MRWKHRLLLAIAPPAASLALRLLSCTLRIRRPEFKETLSHAKEGKGIIFAAWHSRLLGIFEYAGNDINVLVSQSQDGELLARALERFGFATTRGSSSRGGIGALKHLAGVISRGSHVMIAPDGPRGPRERVQLGILQLACLTGAPIVPITWAGSRMRLLKSWDRLRVPMPFSRCEFWTGKPLLVPRDSTKEDLEQKRVELEAEMNRLSEMERSVFPNAPGVMSDT